MSTEPTAICKEHNLPMLTFVLAEGIYLCEYCAMQYFSNVYHCFKHDQEKDCPVSDDKPHLLVCHECMEEKSVGEETKNGDVMKNDVGENDALVDERQCKA